MPDWPDHLDALTAAPEHHKLLFENVSVRVLETRIPPGERTKLHTHRWPAALYFIAAGDFIRRDEAGVVTADSRTSTRLPGPGEAVWSPPLAPHTLENTGSTEIRVISVEMKG